MCATHTQRSISVNCVSSMQILAPEQRGAKFIVIAAPETSGAGQARPLCLVSLSLVALLLFQRKIDQTNSGERAHINQSIGGPEHRRTGDRKRIWTAREARQTPGGSVAMRASVANELARSLATLSRSRVHFGEKCLRRVANLSCARSLIWAPPTPPPPSNQLAGGRPSQRRNCAPSSPCWFAGGQPARAGQTSD